MTIVSDVYRFIDALAPFTTAMGFDNAGLLVGEGGAPVEKALLALDITTPVVEEAKKAGAQLIVSHHPVIFEPLRRLPAESVPYQLARAGIAAICAHTNLDMAKKGVAYCLGRAVGARSLKAARAYQSNPYYTIQVFVPSSHKEAVYQAMDRAGAGALGDYAGCAFSVSGEGVFVPGENAHPYLGRPHARETAQEEKLEMLCPPQKAEAVIAAMRQAHPYEEPAFNLFENKAVREVVPACLEGEVEAQPPERFAALVKARLGCGGVQFVPGRRPVRRVWLCGGAGGEYIADAVACGADALLTGEAKHHERLMAAEAGVTLVVAGHFSTEDVVVEPLAQKLRGAFPAVEFLKSGACQDPARYL